MNDAPRLRGEEVLLWLSAAILVGCLVALPFAVQHTYGLTPAILPAMGGLVAAIASGWESWSEGKVRGWHVATFLGGLIAFGGSYVQGAEARGWTKGTHCIWDFMSEYRDRDSVTAMVSNPTAYPAYECRVTVREFGGSPGAWHSDDKVLFNFDAGTIAPGGGRYVEPLQLGPGDARRFVVDVWTRSGFYFQRVYFRRVHGQWQLASELEDHDGPGVIFQRIDPDFPRDDDGADWN